MELSLQLHARGVHVRVHDPAVHDLPAQLAEAVEPCDTPEEALDEWRRQHPEGEASTEEVAAIQEALTDRVNGDQGMLFEEFDRDFRKRHNLPGTP